MGSFALTTSNDTAVAATAAAKATKAAAAVMIQQQQLVNINLLFPLLLANTDISHGGDLNPKEVNQILREASREEGGHAITGMLRRMSSLQQRRYGEGSFKMSMN